MGFTFTFMFTCMFIHLIIVWFFFIFIKFIFINSYFGVCQLLDLKIDMVRVFDASMIHINLFLLCYFHWYCTIYEKLNFFFIIMNARMKNEVGLDAFALMYIYSYMNYHWQVVYKINWLIKALLILCYLILSLMK